MSPRALISPPRELEEMFCISNISWTRGLADFGYQRSNAPERRVVPFLLRISAAEPRHKMSSSPPTKAALRSSVAAALAALSPSARATQSAAILAHLRSTPSYIACKSASIYLPMDGGMEIDTMPILEDLLSRGVKIAVPRVTGKAPTDMAMLRLSGGIEQARALPRTKWGIPEPTAELAASMEDATEAPDFSVLLVPAVAFDSRCGRLGHGRGYYDAFIARQRRLHASPSAPPLAVIGLGLREQLVDFVPMDEQTYNGGAPDQRMDLVITPDGPLAFTSAGDQAKAAALMAGAGSGFVFPNAAAVESAAASSSAVASGSAAAVDVSDEALEKKRSHEQAAEMEEDDEEEEDEEEEDEEGGGAVVGRATDLSVRCDLTTGRYKYACLSVRGIDNEEFIAIRSGPGASTSRALDLSIRPSCRPASSVCSHNGSPRYRSPSSPRVAPRRIAARHRHRLVPR